MNKYAILKQEYDIKRITQSEVRTVSDILFKCDFGYDVEEWVWTGSNGALLKFTPPNMMGSQPFPQAQANMEAGGYPPNVAHTSGGGFMGLQPVQHHLQHGQTGTTMSGSQGALARQARAGRNYNFETGQFEGDRTPQQEMYEQQFGELKPGAGSRLKNFLSRAGAAAKKYGKQGLEMAQAGGRQGLAAAQKYGKQGMDMARRGGAAAMDAGRRGMTAVKKLPGATWDALNEGVSETSNQLSNLRAGMEQGVKDIGQRMGQAFEDRMRGQMGDRDQRVRITQPDGTTTNERLHMPQSMDKVGMASNMEQLKLNDKRANRRMNATPMPVPLSPGSTTAPPVGGSPAPTLAPQATSPEPIETDADWGSEPPTLAPEAASQLPTMGDDVSGATGSQGTGAVAVSNDPWYAGDKAPGIGPSFADRIQSGFDKYQAGLDPNAPLNYEDFQSSLPKGTQARVAALREQNPNVLGEMSQAIGFGPAARERAEQIKRLGQQGGGQQQGPPTMGDDVSGATGQQPAPAPGGASKGPTGLGYYNPDGTRKLASFDAHQAAWDALLKRL